MRYLYLVLGLLCGATAFAQSSNSATFIIPDTTADSNTEICIPIRVINFSSGIEFSFGLFTPTPANDGALTFIRVQNLNPDLPFFGMEDFDLSSRVNDGVITVDWGNYAEGDSCQVGNPPINLSDGSVLFEACYQVVGSVASIHPVDFFNVTDDPLTPEDETFDVTFNKPPQCGTDNDAFPGLTDGTVTVGVSPIILSIPEVAGEFEPGDVFCADIVAESGFTDIIGFQYGVFFDSTVLRIVSATANTDLFSHDNGDYNLFPDFNNTGLYATWSTIPTTPSTLEDGETLVTLCFEIVGDCGDNSFIRISDGITPDGVDRPIEANGEDLTLSSIPVVTRPLDFRVDNCNPDGFDVVFNCPGDPVSFGDENVCVEVLAGDDFINMREMPYLISFDADVLEFVGITNRNSTLVLDNSDFDFTSTDDGIIILEWSSSIPRSLDEGEVVYEICFNAIGFGGTSPITASRFRNDPSSSTEGLFTGINQDNCAITVQQPGGVSVTFPDQGYSSTQSTCFPLEVNGFTDVTEVGFFIVVPSGQIEFDGFTTAVPGLTTTAITASLVQVTYNGVPFTLPDGGSLGEICFRAIDTAEPGDCAGMLTTLAGEKVVTTESEDNAVNFTTFPGEVCVLFPDGFGLIVNDAEAFINEQVCVPVSVTRFQGIVEVATTFVFDPTLLTYTSVDISAGTWPGLSEGDFDVTAAAAGRITLNWSTPNPSGQNIANLDTVTVFELCFDTGPNDVCVELEPRDAATPAVTTGDGEGSIIYREGEVCLRDKLTLLDISSIPASCTDVDDGIICYEVVPRPNGEDIFIRVVGPRGRVRFGNLGKVEGFIPGVHNYTLYNSGSSVSMTGTVEVFANPDNAAFANAGPDGQLSCGDSPRAVISGRDNIGTNWILFVVTGAGNLRRVDEGTVAPIDGNITSLVDESGTFYLDVISEAGCTARDTVVISPPSNPIANAGDDTGLTCSGDGSVELCATGSSTDNNAVYNWQRVATDGTVLSEAGNTFCVTVNDPGRYRLTVNFPVLSCSATDQVIVSDDDNLPSSDLIAEVALNCDDSPVELNVGEAEDNVTYSWTRAGSATEISNTTTVTTDELGVYVVSLVNTVSGCERIDSTEVVPSRGAPTASLPADIVYSLPCNPDTLLIDGLVYANTGEDTRYRWSSDEGRVVITDVTSPTPRVVLAGDYKVVVSNGTCRDSLTVTVDAPAFPLANAGEDGTLLCTEDFQLTGGAILDGGGEITFQWFSGDRPIPMGAAAAILVNQPGEYALEATVAATGCTDIDSVFIASPDGFPAYTLADTVRGLGCEPSTVRLSLEDPGTDDYVVVWRDPAGTDIGSEYFVSTGVPGVHRVEVTNPSTGCLRTDSVIVLDDAAVPPVVAFRQNSLELACDIGPLYLDGSPSSQGVEFTYSWEAITGGEEPRAQGNDSLLINTAGTYRLTVVNRSNNCSNSRDVIVTDPRVYPMVDIVEGEMLDCDNRETTIGIDILDQPNDYAIQWSGPAGVGSLPMDTTRLRVTTGGTYASVVINQETSCITTLQIRVEDLIDSIATIAIMQPDSFDCNNATITIDASMTELNGTPENGIVWNSFDGNNINPPGGSLIVSVDGPGDYELTITDGSGCTVRDTVRIEAATETPFAQAGEGLEIDCGDMPQLDGSASTPGPLPGILYEWTAIAGGGMIVDGSENSVMPFVTGAGTYQLVVSNLSNGCSDTATTVVSLNELGRADAGADFTTCDTAAMVTGNLPDGTIGVWTAFNDEGSEWSADREVATVSVIGDGLSLVWTLSGTGMGCENFSADTVRVGPEAVPVAVNDILQVGGDENVAMIDLLANDERTGPVTVTLLGTPSFGEIIVNLNGTITFEAPVGLTESTIIEYEVCSVTCPGSCSRATLTIFSSADGTDQTVYNAITPNGDGMNDVFYFEKLARNPGDFPDNELIIFNRWGDILYEARPYNNDWDGTGNGGAIVPEGTYYYLLRLNVGEGDIIRGDVTVVR